jgi:hypothetical protein
VFTPETTWSVSPIIKSSYKKFKDSKTEQNSIPSQELINQNNDLDLISPKSLEYSVSGVSSRWQQKESRIFHLTEVTSMETEPNPTQGLNLLDLSPCLSTEGHLIDDYANAQVKTELFDDDSRGNEETTKRAPSSLLASSPLQPAAFSVNKSTGHAKKFSATAIDVPNSLDILRGRGALTNRHKGNQRFREEARKLRAIYRENGTSRNEKYLLTWELVKRVVEYGGRFLELGADQRWYEMNERDARKKASQGTALLFFRFELFVKP